MSDYELPDISTEGISNMRLAEVQMEAGVSGLKGAMDLFETQATMMTQMMQNITNAQMLSVNPNVGGNINIRF